MLSKKAGLPILILVTLVIGFVAGSLFTSTSAARSGKMKPVSIASSPKGHFMVLWSSGEVWKCNEAWGKNCQQFPLRLKK